MSTTKSHKPSTNVVYKSGGHVPIPKANYHKKIADAILAEGKGLSEPTRVAILKKGAELTTGARNESYGDPVVNMQHLAGLLTAYFANLIVKAPPANTPADSRIHYTFTGEDAAHIMVLAKLSRTANRKAAYHEDNYIDSATYSAIAGECAERERL